MNGLRVAFAAALLASRRDDGFACSTVDETAVTDTVEQNWRLYLASRSLVVDCAPALDSVWRMTAAHVSLIISHVELRGSQLTALCRHESPDGIANFGSMAEQCVFEPASLLFVAAVGRVLSLDRSLALFFGAVLARRRLLQPVPRCSGPDERTVSAAVPVRLICRCWCCGRRAWTGSRERSPESNGSWNQRLHCGSL